MEYILQVKNLQKEYKGFSLNVSFDLKKGYVMGFIGPNGAGKTTTIKLLMNLVKRDGGEVEIFGLDNIENELGIKERVGFVYDENYYYEELTIEQMKRVIAPFYSNWDEEAFHRYMKQFDLPPGKKIKSLSKGMKMKFSLALALSHQAELLIMDEPTSGLDPVSRSELLDILREYMDDENRGIVFSSHVTSDLDKIADYVCFIHQGRLVLNSTKEEIMETYGVIKGEKRVLQGGLRKELIGIQENDYGFSALTRDVKKVKRLCKEAIVIERPTLEDVMLYTIRGDRNA